MAKAKRGFVEGLVEEEIRRMVRDAVADGNFLSTSKCTDRILMAYKGVPLSEGEIANRIMMAAASAGVAVEIGRNQSRSQGQA